MNADSGARAIGGCALLGLAVLGAVVGGCGHESGPPRWNVVVVLVDTLRADHLSTYGYSRSTSPFVDRMAERGVVFQQARSQAACTFPSVNSLLTSRYPQHFQNAVHEHGWAIPGYLPTMAEMLKAVDYSTAAVSSSGIVRVNPSPRNPDGGYGAGFDEFDDGCFREPASCVNRVAFEMLDRLAEPFFLYLHYFEPHSPYQPPESYDRAFATGVVDKRWVDRGELGRLSRELYADGPPTEFSDGDLAHTIDLYDDEIRYFDREFERLVAKLEELGSLDRTLLVLLSDHGEEFLEHGHVYHCRDLTYDTVVRTPMVFWIPGLDQPGERAELAQNLDVLPTVLDYLQVDASGLEIDGASLRPLIEDGEPVHRYVYGVQRYARWVVDGRYKLTVNNKTGETLLFDLRDDPQELTDLSTSRPQVAADLRVVLERWIDGVEGDVEQSARVEAATAVTERLRSLGYLQ